jgi:hypothetical protein
MAQRELADLGDLDRSGTGDDAEHVEDHDLLVDDDLAAEAEVRALLAGMSEFHRREDQPVWWYFARVTGYEPGGPVDHGDCLADLTCDRVLGGVGRPVLHRYRFDPE